MTESRQTIIPACVGGENSRDPLANMPELDAERIVNMFVEQGYLRIREGYQTFAEIGSASVERLFTYKPQSGTEELIACTGGAIYEVTSGTETELADSFTSDHWQSIHYKNRLFLVNGEDAPQTYDGSTLAASGFTGSGLTPSDLVSGFHYKERLYFFEKNTASVWYTEAAANITGALVELDLSTVLRNGGRFVAGGVFSQNLGSGLEDLLCFVTNKGEVLIYYGDHPEASNWTIAARHIIPEPAGDGYNSIYPINGDQLIFTKAGIYPLSIILSAAQLFDVETSLAAKINSNFSKLAFGTSLAWDSTLTPNNRFLIVNIPISNTNSRQYVCNLLSGAWSLFKDLNAKCWTVVNGELYFGAADGKINKLTGFSDNDSEINWEVKWSPNYFGVPTKDKTIHEVLPIIKADSTVNFALAADADFEDEGYSANASISNNTGSDWNDVNWDTAEWSGANLWNKDRFAVPVTGTAISLKIKGSTKNIDLELIALKVLYSLGGSR